MARQFINAPRHLRQFSFCQAPAQFDVILTNPPFGKRGRDAQKNFAFETGSTQVLFVQDILSELAPDGTCAIVLDEGLLFRTNESAFVETKRKLTDECDLGPSSVCRGCFLHRRRGREDQFAVLFTKGKKTEHIWYYDPVMGEGGQENPADAGALRLWQGWRSAG